MARPQKQKEPVKRKLIDLPLWVIDAIGEECRKRKEDGKPLTDAKTYIEMLCMAHVKQSLLKPETA